MQTKWYLGLLKIYYGSKYSHNMSLIKKSLPLSVKFEL